MATAAQPQKIVRFGVFEVDLRAGELRRQGVKIKLQEQPFRVLAVLLQSPGEVVTREELRNREQAIVWLRPTVTLGNVNYPWF